VLREHVAAAQAVCVCMDASNTDQSSRCCAMHDNPWPGTDTTVAGPNSRVRLGQPLSCFRETPIHARYRHQKPESLNWKIQPRRWRDRCSAMARVAPVAGAGRPYHYRGVRHRYVYGWLSQRESWTENMAKTFPDLQSGLPKPGAVRQTEARHWWNEPLACICQLHQGCCRRRYLGLLPFLPSSRAPGRYRTPSESQGMGRRRGQHRACRLWERHSGGSGDG
jgi:hypothetical protein